MVIQSRAGVISVGEGVYARRRRGKPDLTVLVMPSARIRAVAEMAARYKKLFESDLFPKFGDRAKEIYWELIEVGVICSLGNFEADAALAGRNFVLDKVSDEAEQARLFAIVSGIFQRKQETSGSLFAKLCGELTIDGSAVDDEALRDGMLFWPAGGWMHPYRGRKTEKLMETSIEIVRLMAGVSEVTSELPTELDGLFALLKGLYTELAPHLMEFELLKDLPDERILALARATNRWFIDSDKAARIHFA